MKFQMRTDRLQAHSFEIPFREGRTMMICVQVTAQPSKSSFYTSSEFDENNSPSKASYQFLPKNVRLPGMPFLMSQRKKNETAFSDQRLKLVKESDKLHVRL